MATDFQVTITDPQRSTLWQEWIGTDIVCVRRHAAIRGKPADLPEQDVYILDETTLTPAQRDGLVAGLAAHFQVCDAEVEAALDGDGIAILAQHCVRVIHHFQRWIV